MSQSPRDATQEQARKHPGFAAANRKLNALTRQGLSWSGRERNCAFLNTAGAGAGRFANISAVAGFDYLDDGRALGLVDWDHDGDLDVWVTNRTAPRIRFLRNETRNATAGTHSNGQRFLALKLVGRSCNRDAIGARIEVFAAGDGDRHRVRTLRAGEGFVGQSSKWLHFGLGSADSIEDVRVRWPGGHVESFGPASPDRFYVLVQGTAALRPWTPPQRQLDIAPSTPEIPETTGKTRIVLSARCFAPPVDYVSFDGRRAHLDQHEGPVLLNLWASWCLPCAAELKHFTKAAGAIREAGVEIVALSVDGLGDDRSDPQAAADMIRGLDFPFASGATDAGSIARLQLLNDHLMSWRRPLPVPTSLLLDAHGRVAVIYKGPVDVDQLLSDLRLLELEGESLQDAAAASSGTWYWHTPPYRLMPLATKLINKGHFDALVAFATRHRDHLSQAPDVASLLADLGKRLGEKGDWQRAEEHLRAAVAHDPGLVVAQRNLGVALSQLGRVVPAIEAFRAAERLAPEDSVHPLNLGATLARHGRFDEAAAALRRATKLDPSLDEAHRNLGLVLEKQNKVSETADAYLAYVALKPDAEAVHRTLADLLSRAGRLEEAATAIENVLRLQPRDAGAHEALGRLSLALGRLDPSIRHFRSAIRIKPGFARAHAGLGDALLGGGSAKEALDHYRRALELNSSQPQVALAMAWITATSPDPALRDGAEAVRRAEQCIALLRAPNSRALDALAAACAEAGRSEDAVAAATEALKLLRDSNDRDYISQVEARLRLYQSGKPFRTPQHQDQPQQPPE
ncbi:MAG: hypothetical protein CMJ18_07265 [Phycisphaeraceae bacterium]|nr:hypothetical protein [Phycisphaeraceae bacterium]